MGGKSTKLSGLLLLLLLLLEEVGSGGVGEQLWESPKDTSASANVFVHVCGVALCKGMLQLVFLGLCPGPLYYPESVRLCMHRGIDGGRGAKWGGRVERKGGRKEREKSRRKGGALDERLK